MNLRKIRCFCLFIVLAVLLTWAGPGPGSGGALAAEPPSGKIAVQADKPVFGDLPETDGLYPFVRYLAERGIMGGFPDGTFRPAQVLTRAEAAKIAVLAKGLPLLAGGKPSFSDVPAGHWAFPHVETAARAGLFAGYPGGAFGPDDPVTKAQAVTLLLRLSGGALSGGTMSIADVPSGHWAYRPTVTAVQAGLLELSPDGLFSPGSAFSRGELARCLGLLFTLGPDLRAAELTGKLTVIKGRAAIAGEDGNARAVNTGTTAGAGMTVATDGQSRAEITFDDGSGILMEPGTEISIPRAQGFHYMYTDGTPAVAIDKLEIKLNRGEIFFVLANRYEGSEASPTEEAPAWWLYPHSQRERITIEMPAGIAAIWGSSGFGKIYDISLDSPTANRAAGSSVAVLTGYAEFTCGGQTVSVAGGQSSEVTLPSPAEDPVTAPGAAPAPPSPAAPLSQAEQQAFASAEDWFMERAREVQNNAPLHTAQVTPGNVVNVISSALNYMTGNNPAPAPGTAGGSGSGSGSVSGPGSDSPPPPVPTFRVSGTSVHNGGDTIVLTFSTAMNTGTLHQDLLRQGSVAAAVYSDDAGTAAGHGIPLTNAAAAWTGGNVFTITLDELTDQAFIPAGKFLGVTLADTVKSASGTPVSGTKVYSAAAIPGETTAPSLLSWALDMDEGVITMTFDEPVNPATLDLSKIPVVDGDDYTVNTLAGSLYADASFTKTLSITMSEEVYDYFRFQTAEMCLIALEQGAVRDLAGNPSEHFPASPPTDFIP